MNATVSGNTILVHGGPVVGFGRWDGKRHQTVLPATPMSARRVVAKGVPCTPAVYALLEPLGRAAEIRLAGDAPECSPYPSWKHQRVAHAFASALPGSGLFMYMGTGKTKVAIDYIRSKQVRSVLIVSPLRVVDVWHEEIKKWHSPELDGVFIAVTNYERVWRAPQGVRVLANPPEMVILDESHRIKGPGSNVSKFMAGLARRVKYRLALTGTPAHDTPLDLYAQMRFIDQGAFGTNFAQFRARYAVMGGFENRQVIAYANLKELAEIAGCVSLRVDDSVLELPPHTDVRVPVRLSDDTMKVYRTLNKDFVAELQSATVSAQNSLVKMLRLQQITGGTAVDEDGVEHPIDDSKEDALCEILHDAGLEEGIVVFAKFTADLKRIRRAAATVGHEYFELSGNHDQLAEWKSAKGGVIGVQIRSGGSGVDLTKARYAVYYSVGHSLGDYQQSRSRLLRPGQERPVTLYHLVASGTVDELVYGALHLKKEVTMYVMESLR